MARARASNRRETTRHTRLSRRGWLFLATAFTLVILAYALRRPELLFLGCFVAAVPAFSLVLIGLQRPRVEVRRTLTPLVVAAGRTTTVRLDIQNLASRPLPACEWQDAIGWHHRGGVTGKLPALRSGLFRHREPRSSCRLTYEVVPPRRGLYELGPFTLTVSDPFGLARGTHLVHRSQMITVVPQVQVLPDSGLAIAEADGSARLVQHRSVGGDHDITTRAYRTGDPLRRVHWRASAHHGDLMVRQEEQRRHSEASILLDTRTSGYGDAVGVRAFMGGASERFEWAVEFTASLVVHLQRAGFLVHMHESAQTQLASVENTTHFLESMATIQLSLIPEPIDSVLSGSRKAGRAPGSIFAIISDADDDLVHALASRRGAWELAVAFLVMPDDVGISVPLSRAGWSLVVVKPGDSVEDAWMAVVEGDGRQYAS